MVEVSGALIESTTPNPGGIPAVEPLTYSKANTASSA